MQAWHCGTGMGEIGKWGQSSEKLQFGAVQDLSFLWDEKHHLMKEFEIFKIWVKRAWIEGGKISISPMTAVIISFPNVNLSFLF